MGHRILSKTGRHAEFHSANGIYMDVTLTAVFEEVPESEGGGYTAYTEELPGAISEGETLEEARTNLRDAVKVLLEANRQVTPKPASGVTVVREAITVSQP
ncbi:MAG TPA: type II toxin-antitoxin system HicB family antitoxin [Terriglobales bacterium]|jgi:predicted RNase H-like HicB family nuclease